MKDSCERVFQKPTWRTPRLTEDNLSLVHSAIEPCFGPGCSCFSLKLFHLHTGSVELKHSDLWGLSYLSGQGPSPPTVKSWRIALRRVLVVPNFFQLRLLRNKDHHINQIFFPSLVQTCFSLIGPTSCPLPSRATECRFMRKIIFIYFYLNMKLHLRSTGKFNRVCILSILTVHFKHKLAIWSFSNLGHL